jgi:hypothetical protein
VKNYLSERKQRVVINNSTSSWRDINAGVPQRSILEPLLFIVFINDILTDINLTIKLFADDTSLYLIVDDPQETAQTLNDDLVKLHAWSTKWLVNCNPQKTETMTMSRKLNKPHQPNLIMNNTIISTVTEHKHLGLQPVSMSFMKTMNKRGPIIDPWGTPAFMSRQLEVELLITTRCFLSDK